jgi:hypothetical protein
MGGVKTSVKTSMKVSLIVVALASLACLVWLVSRPGEPDAATGSGAARGPSFEVQVEKPRIDRFFFGILPARVEARLLGGGELRFGHASRGAQVGRVARDRLELRADGWELLVETDGAGGIAQGTRLVFPIEIAEVQYKLRCRPADRAVGYLNTTERAGSGELDGSFLVELAACVNAETGKIIDTEAGGNPGDAWPQEPLTLRGSFEALPPGRR